MHPDYLKSCHGKKRYSSRHRAKTAIKEMKRSGRMRPGSAPMPYECRYCGAWHCGNGGKIVLDEVEKFEGLAAAVKTAMANGVIL